MKFFEVCEPYYALIKANTKEKAMKLYIETVADDDGKLSDEMREVGQTYAAIKHGRTTGEYKELMPSDQALDEISNDEEMVLIIDGGLL
ncbi:hypothetical protein FZC77_22355 [Bacillus swezeyi]|uniref:Uncharacterized protein n=1 Tax=Bacillus swezeyi TaxID=1925020 RepID=A0A5M8RH38_9BACI|nr:hypothetical protein DX927_23760 [Bacillus swezeyi]KAA6472153.1 hypothetical protein DX928_22260 [Bacillus swezeyi]TYS32377.1 hypothetical protein FZC77_22355 [Bacillus swezeyi]